MNRAFLKSFSDFPTGMGFSHTVQCNYFFWNTFWIFYDGSSFHRNENDRGSKEKLKKKKVMESTEKAP